MLWKAAAVAAVGGLWAAPASAFGGKLCCGHHSAGTVGTVTTLAPTTTTTTATVATYNVVQTNTLLSGTTRLRGGSSTTSLLGSPVVTNLNWTTLPTATLTLTNGNAITGGGGTTTDADLTKAVTNLASAVSENTKALNALTARLGGGGGGGQGGGPGGTFVPPVGPGGNTLSAPLPLVSPEQAEIDRLRAENARLKALLGK